MFNETACLYFIFRKYKEHNSLKIFTYIFSIKLFFIQS